MPRSSHPLEGSPHLPKGSLHPQEGSPHPLSTGLIDALPPGSRVLLLGVGSGRHLPPLLAAGFNIDVLEEDERRVRATAARFAKEPRIRVARGCYTEPIPFELGYGGALTTHALLHGTPATIATALAIVGESLRSGAPFHLTLGSRADPRFHNGVAVDESTRVATTGAEAGVPHSYFDEAGARELLSGWKILSLEQRNVSETVGRWAHSESELETMVHWFARIERR